MRAFYCVIDETMGDSVEYGWERPTIAKSKWDKATIALANANSKVINAIFCGVSTKVPSKLRTPSFKCSLLSLKK